MSACSRGPVLLNICTGRRSTKVQSQTGAMDDRNRTSNNNGTIGVSESRRWVVLVTIARVATLLDRRRVELVDEGLPKRPHRDEGQALLLDEAVPEG